MLISSSKNPKLRHVIGLIRHAKNRNKSRQFVIENTRFLSDIVQYWPQQIDYVLAHELDPALQKRLEVQAIPILECERKLISAASSLKTNQGVLAVINKKEWPPESNCLKQIIYCDRISNPSNLGAIIRNAVAFEIDAVIYSPDSVDPFHPDALRAMAGNVFQIPLLELSHTDLFAHVDPDSICHTLDISGKSPIGQLPFGKSNVFVFGSEGHGSQFDASQWALNKQQKIRIPMSPQIDSLNVAVTSGIILYQLYQAERLKEGEKG
ncbi:MAG: TrmH family RNA methyltransferase [Candidatus Marinamargulisbacteria bacterium]